MEQTLVCKKPSGIFNEKFPLPNETDLPSVETDAPSHPGMEFLTDEQIEHNCDIELIQSTLHKTLRILTQEFGSDKVAEALMWFLIKLLS